MTPGIKHCGAEMFVVRERHKRGAEVKLLPEGNEGPVTKCLNYCGAVDQDVPLGAIDS